MRILINGVETLIEERWDRSNSYLIPSLSYGDIVRRAYPGIANIEGCSVMYFWKSKKTDEGRQGILTLGQRVVLQEGMRIEAYYTGNA